MSQKISQAMWFHWHSVFQCACWPPVFYMMNTSESHWNTMDRSDSSCDASRPCQFQFSCCRSTVWSGTAMTCKLSGGYEGTWGNLGSILVFHSISYEMISKYIPVWSYYELMRLSQPLNWNAVKTWPEKAEQALGVPILQQRQEDIPDVVVQLISARAAHPSSNQVEPRDRHKYIWAHGCTWHRES